MREQNLAEAPELLAWALRAGYQMRFIEHMPLDAEHLWTMADMVTADEVLAVLGQSFRLRPAGHRGHAPAEEFEVLDGPGRADWAPAAERRAPGRHHRLGQPAVLPRLRPAAADRRRPAAHLPVRAPVETDLRARCAQGASDAELAELIRQAVRAKPAGHGINAPGFRQPDRPMSAIGG